MQQCGFCSMLSGLVSRAMCVGSRRGSSDSYYRELGEQDTLKIDDKSSLSLEESEEPGNEVLVREDSMELCSRVPDICIGKFLSMHRRRKKRLVTRSLLRETALLDDLQPAVVQCILDQSVQWRFNAFTLENVSGGRCLPVLCIHLFHVYGLLDHFKLDVAKAWKLFSLIEEGYHSSNPYHNSVHAADVTQAMHCFLQQKRIRDHLEPVEVMASLIAAIAHDVDHPGVNQPFLIATSNHLAALYQNTSVLENHHWRAAISCLMQSSLLAHIKDVEKKLQDQISALILATDITRQQEYLSQFKAHMDADTLDLTLASHRLLVLQIALKCADISNPCRPWDISRKWSLKVCEEFFRQGDYERRLNLPVTALCDRHTTSIPKIQTGFFTYVVTPLISEWHRFLQTELSSQMLQNLLYNKAKWDTLLAQELAEETATDVSDAELADDELTASATQLSDSAELLLPRRASLHSRQPGLKQQIRRFSVPLNVFQDCKWRRDRSAGASLSRVGSEQSVHSQLALDGRSARPAGPERLLLESSIASITTPREAERLGAVLHDPAWRLVRQQTFPPHEPARRAPRKLHTSNTDVGQKTAKEGRFTNIFKKHTERVASVESTEIKIIEKESSVEKVGGRRESAPVGSQLRSNLQAQAALQPDLLRRRKSMPADTQATVPKEKKMREVAAALPELLRRTLSSKEAWGRRRGSAPAPAGGDLRRKPGPIASCHQWLAKTTYSMHERSLNLPRRSSLPVEVLTGTPSY
ncbi:hypothetical protein JYU34_000517 [Plutella xylostella]|uniref:Phosphodiesterase n=1 Tax=Plutella xylostella TaxID=51655 RepID=A0ABQ7R7X4_PLUXY|nr:hypothetical protein JYU34_000517 [Plutella xylostella]